MRMYTDLFRTSIATRCAHPRNHQHVEDSIHSIGARNQRVIERFLVANSKPKLITSCIAIGIAAGRKNRSHFDNQVVFEIRTKQVKTYGTFVHVIRCRVQSGKPIESVGLTSNPRIDKNSTRHERPIAVQVFAGVGGLFSWRTVINGLDCCWKWN